MINYNGILIGLFTFGIIGFGHVIIIKGEYKWGIGWWPILLVIGLVTTIFSLFVESILISGMLSVFGFSSLWSIHELIKQKERVAKGWFPQNPKRENK